MGKRLKYIKTLIMIITSLLTGGFLAIYPEYVHLFMIKTIGMVWAINGVDKAVVMYKKNQRKNRINKYNKNKHNKK